jgi:hypothetical protein
MAERPGIVRPGSSAMTSRADRRRQIVAFGAISGLVVVAFGLWVVAILTSGDERQLEIAAEPPSTPEAAEESDDQDSEDDQDGADTGSADAEEKEDGDDTGSADSEEEEDGDDIGSADAEEKEEEGADSSSADSSSADAANDDTSSADAGSADAGSANSSADATNDDTSTDREPDTSRGTSGSDDAEPDSEPDAEPDSEPDTEPDSEPPDPELATVTIDEVCTVEVSASERDAAPLRAWEYPDCVYAPVPVEERRERWIVVRASMGAGDFDARAAEERAKDLGVEGGVLWSSHYPSLNPNLWVVYEGPFPDAEAAREAAESVDGEAYARALTTDDDDRFCIAADGCVGERAD